VRVKGTALQASALCPRAVLGLAVTSCGPCACIRLVTAAWEREDRGTGLGMHTTPEEYDSLVPLVSPCAAGCQGCQCQGSICRGRSAGGVGPHHVLLPPGEPRPGKRLMGQGAVRRAEAWVGVSLALTCSLKACSSASGGPLLLLRVFPARALTPAPPGAAIESEREGGELAAEGTQPGAVDRGPGEGPGGRGARERAPAAGGVRAQEAKAQEALERLRSAVDRAGTGSGGAVLAGVQEMEANLRASGGPAARVGREEQLPHAPAHVQPRRRSSAPRLPARASDTRYTKILQQVEDLARRGRLRARRRPPRWRSSAP